MLKCSEQRLAPRMNAAGSSFRTALVYHRRRPGRYEPGQRSGARQKMRVNKAHPFVVAGYTPRARNSTSSCSAISMVGC